MKLAELKSFIENEQDKQIIERMLRDKESTLNNYISSVVSDLLKNIPIDEEYKIKAKNNIIGYDELCIGEIGLYVSLIPYLQLKLKDNNDGYTIVTSIIEMLLSYIVGYINREEFRKYVLIIKETLEISERLMDGIIIYFGFYKENIVSDIIKNTYGN